MSWDKRTNRSFNIKYPPSFAPKDYLDLCSISGESVLTATCSTRYSKPQPQLVVINVAFENVKHFESHMKPLCFVCELLTVKTKCTPHLIK